MHEKLNYEIPEAELLVVRFEESIMSPQGSFGDTNAEEDDESGENWWGNN